MLFAIFYLINLNHNKTNVEQPSNRLCQRFFPSIIFTYLPTPNQFIKSEIDCDNKNNQIEKPEIEISIDHNSMFNGKTIIWQIVFQILVGTIWFYGHVDKIWLSLLSQNLIEK